MPVDDFHEAGVDAVGKSGMVFDQGAILENRCGIHVVNNLYGMGIAHGNDRYVDLMGTGFVFNRQRPDSIVSGFYAVQSLCIEGYPIQCEFGFSHVDGNVAVFFYMQFDNAGFGLHTDGIAVCHVKVGNISCESSGTVATLFDFASVGIEYPVTEIDIRFCGFFDDEDLVGADTESSVSQETELSGCQVNILSVPVQYDEVVSGTVHFGKGQFHV